MVWTVTMAENSGDLRPWLTRIEEAIYDVEARVEPLLDRFPVEFTVKIAPGGVIPERGHAGGCFRPGCVVLAFDPDCPAFAAHLDRPLERTIAHEVHHAARWLGPGYGRTLGEAIVSEGLACRFVSEVFSDPPEPWEIALAPNALAEWIEAARPHIGDMMYDHASWFFGGRGVPRWAGYAIGFELVGRFLREDEEKRASAHAQTPASLVLNKVL